MHRPRDVCSTGRRPLVCHHDPREVLYHPKVCGARWPQRATAAAGRPPWRTQGTRRRSRAAPADQSSSWR
jgi:hypothetical protein